MKTKLQILDETFDYFNNNHPRAMIDLWHAAFSTKLNGVLCHCAVGRCFKDEFKKENQPFEGLDTRAFGVSGTFGENVNRIDYYLKTEYQGHSPAFWKSLQSFHDTNKYWVETEKKRVFKMSDIGLQIYAHLRRMSRLSDQK